MSAFPFKTDDKSEEFCLSIAREMVELFGISEEEAVRRVGKAFSHLPEIAGDQHIFYHEDEMFWAKELYYEVASYWWFTSEERVARGLPPLKARTLD